MLTSATPLKKVLIVDDNDDLRTIFARAFDHRHFDVQTAVDGLEALQRLEKELPDVLILDVNMPHLSGLDVLQRVRETASMKRIKIVVVTGNYMVMNDPVADLADLLLIKPVGIADLVTLSQRLLAAPDA